LRVDRLEQVLPVEASLDFGALRPDEGVDVLLLGEVTLRVLSHGGGVRRLEMGVQVDLVRLATHRVLLAFNLLMMSVDLEAVGETVRVHVLLLLHDLVNVRLPSDQIRIGRSIELL